MQSNSSSNRLITRRKCDIEISRVFESMRAGNLADRAQLDGFDGLDRELLIDINLLLDALTRPLLITADRLAQLAEGDVPAKVTERFSGDLDRLRNSLNSCIDVAGAYRGSSRPS